MNTVAILFIIVAVIVGFICMVFILNLPVTGRSFSGPSWKQNMRSIVSAQRAAGDPRITGLSAHRSVEDTLAEAQAVERVSDGRLTLRKKLKFAQLSHVPPFVFAIAQVIVSVFVFLIVRRYFDTFLQLLSLVTGPMFMNWLLMVRVNRRFKRFDSDYPQFLLSLVGLLKTGLNPIQALESCAQGLEEDSLVRMEVTLMLERLRLGVSEDRSIGSFGEDINHPEIELFVQALLLSRRVGGNLSDTLDRLAKQVRKRQYFRSAANAAVGLQRGSIWFILAVLAGMELFLYFQWPATITVTWTHPVGRSIAQGCLGLMLFGLFWIRQVTKIRV